MDESCAIQTLSSSCIKIARQLKTVSLIKSNFLGSPHNLDLHDLFYYFIFLVPWYFFSNSCKDSNKRTSN